MHHHISDTRKHHQDSFSFTKLSPNDAATTVCVNTLSLHGVSVYLFQNFVSKLKDHLLGRLLNLEYDGDERSFSDTDRNTVHIVNN